MEKQLPIYKMFIDTENKSDEIGLKLISFVDEPAIEIKGITLAKQNPVYLSTEKQIVAGPLLIPDQKIYRAELKEDGTYNEYYITFSKEDIEMIFEEFMSKNQDFRFNIDHTSTLVKSAFIRGAWIVEGESDKSKEYGFDLPIGSLFIEAKVSDKEEWTSLKANKQTGFSIEGLFNSLRLSLNKNNELKNKEQMENKIEQPELEVVLENVEETPTEETSTEVKAEITPEEIAMIWEAIKPLIAEMLVGETKEEAPAEDTEMSAVKSELAEVKAELAAVKESIATTPATQSISAQLSATQIAAHKKYEDKVANMKAFGAYMKK